MSDRKQEFRVGVVALATAAITLLLVSINTGASLKWAGASYPVKIRVDRAPGVGPNTPVRKDGVPIGRVVSTEFLPGGGVMVTASIERGAPIYATDLCRIQPSSLFGDAVINFSFPGGRTDAKPLESGAEVQGIALPDPLEAITTLQVEVAPSIRSIGEAADGVARLTENLNAALGEDFRRDRVDSLLDEVSASLDQFSKTMEQMSATMTSLDRLVSDPELRKTIDAATRDVPAILADARTTVSKAVETLDSFGGVVRSAQANLENLEGFTKPMGDRGPELAQLAAQAIENLNITLRDASKFVAALNASEGTIARLVNDPTLYDNMTTVVSNANIVIGRVNEIAKDLRPVVYDARVFMDKIAREPGRLVRGAINEGPGVK